MKPFEVVYLNNEMSQRMPAYITRMQSMHLCAVVLHVVIYMYMAYMYNDIPRSYF